MRARGFDVDRMVLLRLDGWSYLQLAYEFGRDRTTIIYHCKKRGIFIPIGEQRPFDPDLVPQILPVAPPKPPPKYAHIIEEKMNRGKRSYKYYLKEAMKRETERNYYKTYYDTPLSPARCLKDGGQRYA